MSRSSRPSATAALALACSLAAVTFARTAAAEAPPADYGAAARVLAFRFGYPDYAKKDGHLLVTKKP